MGMSDNSSLLNDCWRACYHDGDIEKVRGFLESGVDINQRAPCSGACPLDASLHGQHMPLFNFLLEAGANVNGIGYGDGTPLMAAVNYQLVDAVTLLLQYGADPNLASPRTGETPLHIAALRGFADGSTHCARLLVDAGANPNAKTKIDVVTPSMASGTPVIGESPLHWAAAFGSQELIKLLIQAGADKRATDARGDTPLIWYGRHQRTSPHIIVERNTLELLD